MFTKHGLSNTRVKRIYYGMLTRCNNESDLAYPYYGGRGIGVCERWEKSIENFYEDMGYPPPKYTLDRIDNNGNYEPKNCRWATRKTQMANRRNNHIINFNGKSKNITDWSDDLGINYATLIKRVKRYGINKYTISSNRYKKEELKLILGVK